MMGRADGHDQSQGQGRFICAPRSRSSRRLLDGKVVKVPPKEDPRKALADWMIAAG